MTPAVVVIALMAVVIAASARSKAEPSRKRTLHTAAIVLALIAAALALYDLLLD